MIKYLKINLILAITFVFIQSSAYAHDYKYRQAKGSLIQYTSILSGAQEVTDPAGGVEIPLFGRVTTVFNSAYSNMTVSVRLSRNSEQTIVAMHFHCGRAGQNGPLAMGLIAPGPLTLINNRVWGTLTNADVMGSGCEDILGRPINNLVSLAKAMDDGLIYLNVHSTDFPAGVVRGQLSARKY